MPPFEPTFSRRSLLKVFAGAATLAATGDAIGGESRIGGLIAAAQPYPHIAQRIDFISHALLGARYKAYPLIGGPREKEVFVTRDDAFDCVTYCETVLAAARARDLPTFESHLQQIRYRDGVVAWNHRNHAFAEWSRRNTENKILRPVTVGSPIAIEKTIDSPPALGKRRMTIAAIPRATLMSNTSQLATGDIIGFVSRRSQLDYFHVGFIVQARDGALLLRHASQSRRKVAQEPLERFFAVNGTRYVTLLRAEETARPPAA